MEERRRGLGRGLSALFAEEKDDAAALEKLRQVRSVPVEQLRPGRFQPRRRFDEAEMKPLVDSVREKGVLQPLLVRRLPEPDSYEIVAGERRWRAAQAARLHEVPVVVRELGDREALEVALVENIQRQDLGPLEEAEGYQRLIDEFGHTQEALARAVGKSRSHIANMLRLLGLPAEVKTLIDSGALSAGHARALIGARNPAALAAEIAEKGLSVREAEALAGAAKAKRKPSEAAGTAAKDADTRALEAELSALLGLRVTLALGGEGGTVAIRFRTLDQLDDVLRRLKSAG
jgi:ParB family transcriptional regulator, chromosome partitioning protein